MNTHTINGLKVPQRLAGLSEIVEHKVLWMIESMAANWRKGGKDRQEQYDETLHTILRSYTTDSDAIGEFMDMDRDELTRLGAEYAVREGGLDTLADPYMPTHEIHNDLIVASIDSFGIAGTSEHFQNIMFDARAHLAHAWPKGSTPLGTVDRQEAYNRACDVLVASANTTERRVEILRMTPVQFKEFIIDFEKKIHINAGVAV